MQLPYSKKIIIGLVLSVLALSPLFPLKTLATDGGGSWAQFHQFLLKEFTLDATARGIARVLFNTIVNQMISKIKTGGRNGGPAFVESWRNFQTNAQYRGEDVFRAILANTQVCGYLRQDIDALFRTSTRYKIPLLGQNIRIGDLDPYTLRAKCTLPAEFDVVKYRQDFAKNGGWSALLKMTEPQNNPYGLYLLSQNEIAKQRALEELADKSEAARGFTGFRRVQCQGQGTGTRCIFLGQIVSPPDLVAKAAGTILQQNLEWLTNIDEMSDIVAGLGSYVFQYFSDLSSSTGSSGSPYEGRSQESDKYEYCSAQRPRNSVVQQYISVFNPFGNASTGSGGPTGRGSGPCGDPNSSKNRENPYPYQTCVQACLQKLGVIPADFPVPTLVPFLTKVTDTPTPRPPTPSGGTVPPGSCAELPAGQSGPFASEIQSAAAEIRNSTTGILDGGSWPYTVLDIDRYFEEMERVLESRGFQVVRDPNDPNHEIAIWRTGSATAEQYNIRRSDGVTRSAHKATNCALPS